jgi:hypothetical protein
MPNKKITELTLVDVVLDTDIIPIVQASQTKKTNLRKIIDLSKNEIQNTQLKLNNNTTSTSTGTGTLVVTGGVGISGSVYAGSIQNTPIGTTTRSSGAFTTLTSNNATSFTAGVPSNSTSTGTLVVTGGVGISASMRVGASIYAGSIESTPIGTSTRSSGAFTTLTSNNATTFTAGVASNSTSTGTLVVNGGVGVSGIVRALGMSAEYLGVTGTTDSASTSTGALVVTGGVGVGGRITANDIHIKATTASTNTNSGALVVTGGVGIGGNINIGATTASTNTNSGALKVSGGTGIAGNCYIGGMSSIGGICYIGFSTQPIVGASPNLSSTSTSTGTLVVNGGVGINGNVTAQGYVSGNSFISTSVSLKPSGIAGLRNYTDKAALIAATSGTAFPFGTGSVAGDIAMVAGVICFYNGTKWQKPAALADL